jgi:ABC-type phosphate/phosphonate transport system substrate-binding protein
MKMTLSATAVRFCLCILVASLIAPSWASADLIFSSAPRDTKEKEEALYKPITDLLTRATGQKVTFEYGDNFLVYQERMRKGAYDIVLDGPAFVAWRMKKLDHVPLVKFPGNLSFVVVTKKSEDRVKQLSDLTGRTICGFAPPNIATLDVLYEFDNPARQPLIIETDNFKQTYQWMASGRCVGAILQPKILGALDKDKQIAKIVFHTKPIPNQAISAGPRVSPETRDKIVKALLSPEGMAATQQLRAIYKVPTLLAASGDEYQGLEKLLRDVWGFDQ